jgi:hypothetical protein
MIEFKREGAVVKVHLDTGAGWTLWPKYECSDELYAILLRDRLANRVFSKLQSIREEAYSQGYADGRGKKAKRSYHAGYW